MCIRLWGPNRRAQHCQPKGELQFLVQFRGEDGIAVMDQEPIWMITGDGFAELLQCPLGGRVTGHVAVQNAAAANFHGHKDKQHLEAGCDRNQEVAGDDALRMILDEGHPVL